MVLDGSGAWEMAGLEPIEVIAHFQIGHAHHPLHQVLPMGIKPFASFQRFDQQIEQLSFGCCVGMVFGAPRLVFHQHRQNLRSIHHQLEGLWSGDPKRCLPHLRGRRLMTPLNVTCLLGVR